MSRQVRAIPPQRDRAPDGVRRFSISCDDGVHWSLGGLVQGSSLAFTDLASALAFARRDSDAAEAMIELRVDGLYACIRQPKGWPQRICASRYAA